MGGNLMNPRRRMQVLDTALATSAAALEITTPEIAAEPFSRNVVA
jgi:hypothetical protein